MAYEGGYTSAVNSGQNRQLQEIQAMFERERLREAQAMFAQQQQQQMRQRMARTAVGNMLPELTAGGGGPQPPMPGQSSLPMMPPPPQQGGMQPSMPPGAQGGPPPMPPPSMAGQFMTMPPPPATASPPPGGPAPMPQGGGSGAPMMRSGTNAPGAPGGPGGAPMALPPMPDRWKALPAPPSGQSGDGSIPAPPGEGAVMPRSVVSVADMAKLLASRGIKGEAAMDMLEEWKPYMDSDNKRLLDQMKTENAAQAAALRAYAAVMQANAAQTRAGTGVTRAQQAGQKLERVDIPKAEAYVKKHGGGTPGNARAIEPPKDSADQTALDVQAWNYLNGKGLPYRKGTGGGKDKNDAVMHRVGEIANELHTSAEELMAMPAEFKANAQSLAFQTKKLDAIEGQLRSFHNNIDTWDSLAQGLAPKIGGERVKAMAKDLEKINFVGVKSFDEVKLKLESQFNDPTVSAYMVAAMAAAMDYARIMQGPQSIASLTEGARKDAERLISASMDDGARRAVIGTLESDTEGQVKGIRDQLGVIRGRLRTPGQSAAGDKVREFKSEAEAQAANLAKGTRVKINGVTGTWQ